MYWTRLEKTLYKEDTENILEIFSAEKLLSFIFFLK